MSKLPSNLFNLISTLLVITLISGFLLGYINQITLIPKAKVKAEIKKQALQAVLPVFDNDMVHDVLKLPLQNTKDTLEIFPAYAKGELVGMALVGSSQKGFSGTVKTMIGYLPDGSIYNIVVLEQKETPGLGTKMKESKFIKQFIGKNPNSFNLKVKKDGGQVDALTGATISTRAFSETVQTSFEVLEQNKDKVNTKSITK